MIAIRCSSNKSPRAVRASFPGGSNRRPGLQRAARTPRSIRSASSTSRDVSASKVAGRPGRLVGEGRDGILPARRTQCESLGRAALPRIARRSTPKASARAGEPWIADLGAEIRDAALDYKSSSGADRTVALGWTRLALVTDSGRHRLDLRVSDAADLDLAVALEANAGARQPHSANCRSAGASRARRGSSICCRSSSKAIDNASGEAALDFTVAGRVAAPVLEGEARLARARSTSTCRTFACGTSSATMRLKDTALTLDATGKAGEGTLDIDGRFGWRDRRLNGDLSADRRSAAARERAGGARLRVAGPEFHAR